MTTAAAEVPRLYTITEVCELLQCESESWLTDRVRSGEFPARRICRQRRFSVDDINDIIAACVHPKANDIPVPTSSQRGKNPRIGVVSNVGIGR